MPSQLGQENSADAAQFDAAAAGTKKNKRPPSAERRRKRSGYRRWTEKEGVIVIVVIVIGSLLCAVVSCGCVFLGPFLLQKKYYRKVRATLLLSQNFFH